MGGTAAVRQTLVTLCCTALFKAEKEPTKMPSKKKKKKKKKSETAILTVSKQSYKKQKISYYLLHQHRPVL